MEINLMRGEMFDEIRSVLSDLYGADAVASIAGGVKIKEQVSDIYCKFLILYFMHYSQIFVLMIFPMKMKTLFSIALRCG